jgi:hypothetical protein
MLYCVVYRQDVRCEFGSDGDEVGNVPVTGGHDTFTFAYLVLTPLKLHRLRRIIAKANSLQSETSHSNRPLIQLVVEISHNEVIASAMRAILVDLNLGHLDASQLFELAGLVKGDEDDLEEFLEDNGFNPDLEASVRAFVKVAPALRSQATSAGFFDPRPFLLPEILEEADAGQYHISARSLRGELFDIEIIPHAGMPTRWRESGPAETGRGGAVPSDQRDAVSDASTTHGVSWDTSPPTRMTRAEMDRATESWVRMPDVRIIDSRNPAKTPHPETSSAKAGVVNTQPSNPWVVNRPATVASARAQTSAEEWDEAVTNLKPQRYVPGKFRAHAVDEWGEAASKVQPQRYVPGTLKTQAVDEWGEAASKVQPQRYVPGTLKTQAVDEWGEAASKIQPKRYVPGTLKTHAVDESGDVASKVQPKRYVPGTLKTHAVDEWGEAASKVQPQRYVPGTLKTHAVDEWGEADPKASPVKTQQPNTAFRPGAFIGARPAGSRQADPKASPVEANRPTSHLRPGAWGAPVEARPAGSRQADPKASPDEADPGFWQPPGSGLGLVNPKASPVETERPTPHSGAEYWRTLGQAELKASPVETVQPTTHSGRGYWRAAPNVSTSGAAGAGQAVPKARPGDDSD